MNAPVSSEEGFQLLSQLGLVGWSVQIVRRPAAFAARAAGDELPLLVRAERDGRVIERACRRSGDVVEEIVAEAKRAEL